MTINDILRLSPVICVVVVDDPMRAVPLARAVLAGGLSVIEVTLRSEAALDSVREMRAQIPDAVVGVGTVLSRAQFAAAAAAGAAFAVSPGLTPALAEAARESGLPYLPGAATASEVLAARQMGFTELKFFPAAAAGGVPVLAAFGDVYPDVTFCPTGGINPGNLDDFLNLGNVACVGGSWIASATAIAEADWDGITARAREAASKRTG